MNLILRTKLPVCALFVVCALDSGPKLTARAQTQPNLNIQLYPGLSITGSVGTVYQIQYVTNVAQASNANAWLSLEFLQLPSSPFLWIDKTATASTQRFYEAVPFLANSNLVFIPPGSFRMGSPTNEIGRSADEGPQTDVIITRGFWMGKNLVTQGEYQALTGMNPSMFNSGDKSLPVESVSIYDAANYCSLLTQQERSAGHIAPNSAYQLPTEAQWEYACRSWTSTRFSYGDDPGYLVLTNYAWYVANSGGSTHPVGQKLPNPWGLYDMHGNVEQWCMSWYGPYPGGILVDPQGAAPGGQLVVARGGVYSVPGFACRSATRIMSNPAYPSSQTGFRVVLVSSQP